MPFELFKRLSSYTFTLYTSFTTLGFKGSGSGAFYVNNEREVVSSGNLSTTNDSRYIYGFIALKDI